VIAFNIHVTAATPTSVCFAGPRELLTLKVFIEDSANELTTESQGEVEGIPGEES